jgi:hypothetical protein
MTTSTPAKANSAADISPVGPPPATTTSINPIPIPHVGFRTAIVRHDPGLVTSAPVRRIMNMAGEVARPIGLLLLAS